MNTLESEISKPFKSVGHALSYYNECNPCRARSLNLFEPERGIRPDFADFSGLSPRDKWAAIVHGLEDVLRNYSDESRLIFELRNFGDDRTHHPSADEIAETLNLKKHHVYKVLRDIRDDLEEEFRYRELIPDEDEN